MKSQTTENPIAEFLAHRSVMILDGGLATALESRGFDLNDELWSARVLMEAPEAIGEVHHDYLLAGADCITTSSYQASIAGFQRRGLTEGEAIELLLQSVTLALDARARFWNEKDDSSNRQWPLVAASIGPYGAFLADGSEYTGAYNVEDEVLEAFHRRRWEILADSQADLLGCETNTDQ
jgi:homocysteine S-methyltransferase